MKLYNTLTRKKEEFKPIGKEVKIYSCGPTVYDSPHIGNLRAFIFADLLKRYLKFKKYKIKHVMNITDIDDKLIKKSKGKKEKLKQITKKYTKVFFDALSSLNIEKADIYPRATEHIKEMSEIVEKLLKKNLAYKTTDGIYFNIKKFKPYGKLSGLKKQNLKKTKSRIDKDEYDKSNARDFALWKFHTKEDGEISWQTSLGKGRPGWHIECSAMSSKYLGQPFDIHTGGIDLVFPHHENEIAQSEAAFGKKFVKYWIHNEHLIINGRKMSKSLGNFYTLEDLLKKYNTNTLRYLLLSTHYRQKLNLTEQSLKAAEKAVFRIMEFLSSENKKESKEIPILIKKTEKEFISALDDDLNISKALATIFNFIRKSNKLGSGKKSKELIKKINSVLGLKIEKQKIPKEVKELVDKREKARKNKEWKEADKLRDKIKKLGFQLDDTTKGVKIKKIK